MMTCSRQDNRFAIPFPFGRRLAWVSMLVVAVGVGLGTAAKAQDANVQGLLDRLERAERDIRTLNRNLARGATATTAPAPLAVDGAAGADSSASTPMVAQLAVRMNGLEEEFRQLTGRVEEYGYQVRQIADRLDKVLSDLEFRLNRLEGNPGAASSLSAAPQAAPGASAMAPTAADGAAPMPTAPGPQTLGTLSASDLARLPSPPAQPAPIQSAAEGAEAGDAMLAKPGEAQQPAQMAAIPDTPAEHYNQAFGLLRARDFTGAEHSLNEFLTRYPDHELTSNARYWLGETYYVREDYVAAARTFLEGYQKAPGGPKAADTLLKLGMSLAALNKTREACAAFQKLAKDHPEASDNIRRHSAREREKYACN